MRTITIYGSLAFVLLLIGVASASMNVRGLQVDSECSDVELIFARGSGQSLQDGESERFFEQVTQRVQVGAISINPYELGTETYGNFQYSAITVGEWWKNGNAIGASLSAGYSNDYGKSVDAGVGELQSYLTQRHAKCPDARIILGGYSQGAQVIGQTLPKLSAGVQSRIDFVALFGDPKLHLPEGEGVHPDACRGKNFSEWRRKIGNCHADGGSLGARKPFLPESMVNKTGLWCLAVDFVCGTSKMPYDTRGHGRYKDVNGAIDAAAIEIAERVKVTLPAIKSVSIDIGTHVPGVGMTGSDVLFMINLYGMTADRLEQIQQSIRVSVDRIGELRGHAALAYYQSDAHSNHATWIGSYFTDDKQQFFATLSDIESTAPYEQSVLSDETLDTLLWTLGVMNWRSGAAKSVILFNDAPIDTTSRNDNLMQEIAKLSLEIDPVNVYPITTNTDRQYDQELARLTSGEVIYNAGDLSVATSQTMDKIAQRPTALLKNTEYSAQPGQEVTFDASDSYVIDATITKYEWDFNGDNIFEQTTAAPVAHHTHADVTDGVMQVRMTASNDTIANASAFLKIGTKVQPVVPQAPTNLTATVQSTSDKVSTVSLAWEPSDNNATSWVISMNGVPLGTIAGDRTTIDVTDVLRDNDVEISVTGMTGDSELGEVASVIVAKEVPVPAPEPVRTRPVSNWPSFLYDLLRKVIPDWTHFMRW